MKSFLTVWNDDRGRSALAATFFSLAALLIHGSATAAPIDALVWDADQKEAHVEAGAAKANFQFWFTNTTSSDVIINSAKSSCFCTVAKLPSEPWTIPAGSSGSIDVAMDLAGKRGTVTKPVNVATSIGNKTLLVRVTIPYDPVPAAVFPVVSAAAEEQRLKNLQMSLADRQVVFKKAECAECHAKPAIGRASGEELYAGVCANCHDSPHRASTVPDLKSKGAGQNLEYWRSWIADGRPGTMMPAFAHVEGGPLSEGQLESLAEHLAMSVDAPDASKAAANVRRGQASSSEFSGVLPPVIAK